MGRCRKGAAASVTAGWLRSGRRSGSASPSRGRTGNRRAGLGREAGNSRLTLLGRCSKETGHLFHTNVVLGGRPDHSMGGVVVPAKAEVPEREARRCGGSDGIGRVPKPRRFRRSDWTHGRRRLARYTGGGSQQLYSPKRKLATHQHILNHR